MAKNLKKSHVCFFVGHRDAPEELYDEIHSVIGLLCEQKGITEFWSGGYGTFDRMCERAVRAWKQSGAEIRLVLVLAYPPQTRQHKTERYSGYDELYLPELGNVPAHAAITRRNQLIAAKAEYVLAWVNHDFGGACKTLTAAERAGAVIIRVEQHENCQAMPSMV